MIMWQKNALKMIPFAIGAILTLNFQPVNASEDVWLLVDTEKQNMEVKKGDKTIAVLEGIAIGRSGAGTKQHRGDDVTPVGNYRIGWVNHDSSFHKFFGMTYPNANDAEQALKKGLIDENTYQAIVRAEETGSVPPQNTPLGGQIGIHGLGSASEKIHRMSNWTHGCIALTNTQIEQLSQWVDRGTLVSIK